uniref:B-cell translocation gene 4 n=1 Tax=Seriola dumerili TaxID=41447 RepID=A0A3B4U1F8_SERDU
MAVWIMTAGSDLLPPSPLFCLRATRTTGTQTYPPRDRPTVCKGVFLQHEVKTVQCLRMNRVQLQDPVLQQACERSEVSYEDLGLPREVTVWVDPGEVSCRYGEHSTPFCVSVVDSCRRGDGEFSRRIHDAVERASLDIQSGSSSDEEDGGGDNSMSSGNVGPSAVCPAPVLPTNPEPKTIPTVSNPNSVYRFVEFSSGAPQTWLWEKRKAFAGDTFPPHAPPAGGPTSQFSGQKGFKSHRATFTFSGPRVDKYHWISKSRS